MIMRIEKELIKVSFEVGATLDASIKECLDFCIKYDVDVIMTFNDKKRIVTPFSNETQLRKHYYRPKPL